MAVNLSPYGGVGAQFLDNSGNVLTGGKIYTYSAGTTTPQPTYTTNAGNIPHPNPIILDAAGRVPSGGEIWLTDGLTYKFILRDANDVLIATYDNVIGINSNFVNFTNQQEIQIATAGQTVFNFTTMQYQPGTNSLSVFVDGVNQYGPGAQYSYVETDSDTVTFVNGLHVGAEVKFTTSQLNTSGGVDAQQVSYNPPFTGGVATNVEAKLAETISVTDFGAVGDGVTDNYAAISAAVLAARGKNLYFPEGQYLIDTDNGSIVLEEVGLIGEFVHDGANPPFDQGSVLQFVGTTNTPFLVRRGVTMQQLGFYYPNQIDSPTPVVYPPTLEFDFSNGPVQFVYIQDCVVYNAWRWLVINDATGNVGHIWVENNTIYGISRAIEITKNLEVIKILGNTFTFGHWLAVTPNGCAKYTRENGIAIQYDEGDGFWFANNLIYGYLRGISITGGRAVLTTIDGNSFDQVLFPVLVESPGSFEGSNISNNIFLAFNSTDTTQLGNGIFLRDAKSLTITGNLFGTTTGSQIVVSGTSSGSILVTGNTFESIGAFQTSGTFAAVFVDSPNKTFIFTDNYVGGANNTLVNGVICTAATVLHIGQNVFVTCHVPLSVQSAGNITSVGNASYGTVAALSDDITGATRVWQTGNSWDKPSLVDTKPAFLVRLAGSQTFNSATPTAVTFGTTQYDNGSNFSVNTFTAPVAGKYWFAFSLLHNATGTPGDQWKIAIKTSSGNFEQTYTMPSTTGSIGYSSEVQLTAGQTAQITIARISGSGNLVLVNDASANYFTGSYEE